MSPLKYFVDLSLEMIDFTFHPSHNEFLIEPHLHSDVKYCKHVNNVIIRILT